MSTDQNPQHNKPQPVNAQPDTDDLADIDAQLETAAEQAHTAQPTPTPATPTETPSGATATSSVNAKPTPDDVERQRMERAKARAALRRTPDGAPPATPGAAGRPIPAWGKSPSAAPSGSPAPYVDPRMTAQQEQSGPPEWLGTRWREIPPEQQQEAWVGLRRWVDWFTHEFQLPSQVVPACWYRHPNLVQELYAAMSMEYKAWEEGTPSLTPMMMFHPNVAAMIQRLRDMVQEAGTCAKGEHKPISRMIRNYDEDDWRKVAYGRRETLKVLRPKHDEARFLLRPEVRDKNGKQLVQAPMSQTAGILPVQGITDPEIVTHNDPTTATSESHVQVEVYAVPDAASIHWDTTPVTEPDEHGNRHFHWKEYTRKPEQTNTEEHSTQTPTAPMSKEDIPEESRL